MLKKNIFIICIVIGILSIMQNQCFALLQSIPNAEKTISYGCAVFITNIRKMEELNGGFGFNEELNEDLTPKTSNNIDVHLQKNTEFGAMAILSASDYGNPNYISAAGDTTTGNKTGIYCHKDLEIVAAYSSEGGKSLGTINNRYVNLYDKENFKEKAGDALTETSKWHNGGAFTGFGSLSYIGRFANKKIFTVVVQNPGYTSAVTGGRGRAVIVCGEGF